MQNTRTQSSPIRINVKHSTMRRPLPRSKNRFVCCLRGNLLLPIAVTMLAFYQSALTPFHNVLSIQRAFFTVPLLRPPRRTACISFHVSAAIKCGCGPQPRPGLGLASAVTDIKRPSDCRPSAKCQIPSRHKFMPTTRAG
jgi:hypothetical protein